MEKDMKKFLEQLASISNDLNDLKAKTPISVLPANDPLCNMISNFRGDINHYITLRHAGIDPSHVIEKPEITDLSEFAGTLAGLNHNRHHAVDDESHPRNDMSDNRL